MPENWVKILETNKNNEILEYLKNEFEKNNIPYKIGLGEKWEGSIRMPKYIGKFSVYVQSEFLSEAEKIIEGYFKEKEIKEEVNIVEDNEEQNIEIDKELEIERQKTSKKQKRAIKIYMLIIIIMVISFIVGAWLNNMF